MCHELELNDLDLEEFLTTPPFTIILDNEGCQFLPKMHLVTNTIQFNFIFWLDAIKNSCK